MQQVRAVGVGVVLTMLAVICREHTTRRSCGVHPDG
jgi:hypothetical protein